MGKPPKKLNNLSLREKISLIELKEAQIPVKELCSKFKCGRSTIYEVLKRKDELRKRFEGGANSNQKRKRRLENEDIDEITLQWFSDARANGIPVSGGMIKEKAKEIAEKLGKEDFKASNGWLKCFKDRHNITGKQITGESTDVCHKVVADWNVNILTEGYEPKNIFNCGETGLFFREPPTKALIEKAKECMGDKHSTDRLTLLLCCNMTGEMEKPLVIGKPEKVECLENSDVTWRSQGKSWMTPAIMEDWLKCFNHKMTSQNRDVLLFLSNAPCHPPIALSNVKLRFFPNNPAAEMQPLDQGVFKLFKTYYKKFLLRSLVPGVNEGKSITKFAKNITAFDAVEWLGKSHSEILQHRDTIVKCFKKAIFGPEESESETTQIQAEYELETLMNHINSFLGPDAIDLDDFLDADNAICTCETQVSIDGLIQEQKLSDRKFNKISIDEDGKDIFANLPIQSYEEALTNIKRLETFFTKQGDTEIPSIISALQCAVELQALQQTPSELTCGSLFWES